MNKQDKHDQDKRAMIRRMLTSLLTFSPAFLAFLILSMYTAPLPPLIWSLISFLIGCPGAIIVIRKEIPMPLQSVRGKSAVIQGAGLAIFCWLLAIYFAIYR